MSEREKVEMMKLVMPILMKDFNKSDWKKMIQEMSTEMRETSKEMMMECLRAMEETKNNLSEVCMHARLFDSNL